ncbi:YhdP family protein [Pseudidiomarina homiensis]|uniref:YhdP family protein n=1 Tax=Pseudidiomarina homiensis TaxID=364198 RepID=UPI00215B144C|nr:YhdP family protein [Pseudidiomarina homiensis]
MWRVSLKVAYRTLLYSIATALVLFAVLLSVLRYLLPQLPDVTHQVERFFADNYAAEIVVGQLGADWNSAGPQLILQDIEVQRLAGEATQFQLNEARVVFNFWQSLRTWSLKFEQVTLANLQLTYDLRNPSLGENADLTDTLPRFFLNQLDQVTIEDSRLELINLLGVRHAVDIERLSWSNQGRSHQGFGSLRLADLAANSLDVIIDVEGNDPRDLAGQIYVRAENLDIAGYLQQKVVDAQISQAEFNFTMWLNFAQSDFRNGILQLGRNELHWKVAERRHQLVIPKGLLKLRPSEKGWLVNNNPITLVQDDTTWTLPTVSWLQTPDHYALSAEDVPLAPLVQLATLTGSRGQEWADKLREAAFTGAVDVSVEQKLRQPLQWQIGARDIAWQSFSGIPGLTNVSLDVRGSGRQGHWRLQGAESSISSAYLSDRQAWRFEQLAANGRFTTTADTWELSVADTSRFDLVGLPLRAQARLRFDQELYIDAKVASAAAEPIPADVLRQYMPQVMGADLYDYLQTALLEGAATGIAMVWRGPVADFPYQKPTGVFRAQASIEQLVYRFQPNWPVVSDAKAYVHFGNERMHILTTDAVIEGVTLPQVDTKIADILVQPSTLTIEGAITGPSERLQPLFAASPLADSLGTTLTELQLSGPLRGALQLTIPLDNSRQVVAEGYADLEGNDLYVDSLGENFTDLRGRIHYRNDAIDAEDLTFAWQRLPVTATLEGRAREQDYHVKVAIDALWSMTKLAEQKPTTAQIANGNFAWQGQLALSLPETGGYSFHWQQQSDLNALELTLPEPFALGIGEAMPWQLQVSGGPESLLINSTLGEHSLLELQYNGDASVLQQGYGRIGERVGQLPNPDLLGLNPQFPLEVGLGQADAAQWLDTIATIKQWWSEQQTASDRQRNFASPIPDVIEVQVATLEFGEHRMHDNAIVLWPQEEPVEQEIIDTWRFNWRAQEAVMQGSYWPAFRDRSERVEISADYFELAAPVAPEQVAEELVAEVEEAAAPQDFSRWPEFQFACKRCSYGAYDLGEVAFRLIPDVEQVRLDDIRIRNGEHELNAQLRWLLATADQAAVTAVTGTFNSEDLGNFLSDYDITSIVQDSPADFDFELVWQGTPEAFNVASLDGSMNWRLGQGYLNDVSDGGARIFSVLSLESILRKLQFDFRDIFANGLFFTEFAGQFAIDDGVVSTEQARMNGSAGDMEISGTSNLVTNAIDYQLYFVPKVTSSLPVILAWMVNPPSGLAALLIDRMLQDAQVISRLEYKISGTIDEPIVEEVSRDSREVPIPVDQLPQEEPDAAAQESSTDSGTNDQPAGAAAEPENN